MCAPQDFKAQQNEAWEKGRIGKVTHYIIICKLRATLLRRLLGIREN